MELPGKEACHPNLFSIPSEQLEWREHITHPQATNLDGFASWDIFCGVPVEEGGPHLVSLTHH